MKRLPAGFVSLHPYFKVHPGKLNEFKGAIPKFMERSATEGNRCLFYEFTINGDEIFCREGYPDATAAIAHLNNVGPLLADALQMADLIRVEAHGPAAELARIKKAFTHLNVQFFETMA